jgi:hypothetical protein
MISRRMEKRTKKLLTKMKMMRRQMTGRRTRRTKTPALIPSLPNPKRNT